MNNKSYFLVVGLLLAAILVGCPLPMYRMQAVFKEDLRLTVGQTIEELSCCPGRFLHGRHPDEVKELDNGNLLHVYGAYKSYKVEDGVRVCDVFLELTPTEAGHLRVVSATSEGNGCYRAY